MIETTRSNAERVEHLDAHAVEDVLLGFFRDPWASHAKARWLRRAMKLPFNSEDNLVEERLQRAVADCFAVLQSLLSNTHENAAVILSPRCIACAALFLYLQGLRSCEPMQMQEHSARARARDSHTILKQHVTSDQLG